MEVNKLVVVGNHKSSDPEISLNLTPSSTSPESIHQQNDKTSPMTPSSSRGTGMRVAIDKEIQSMRADVDSSDQVNLSNTVNGNLTDTQQSINDVNKFAVIDKSGICSSCEDADAHSSAISCFICCEDFHGVCRDAIGDKTGDNTICTRSFFSTYDRTVKSDKYKNRPGNFVFVCDVCMTQHEQKKTVKQENKIDIIDKRVDKLTEGMDEMKNLLTQFLKLPQTPILAPQTTKLLEETVSPSYSSIIQKSILKPSPLVVEKCDQETIEKLIVDNSIHIDKKYKNKSGSTVLICPTEQDRKNLHNQLTSKLPSVKATIPPDRLPTIAIANLSKSYSNTELAELILHAHPDISQLVSDGETFSVLNVKPHQKDSMKFQATIRVSSKIRQLIEDHGDRIYIGSFSCKVFDRFFVKRCNKCQKFNHYMADCKENNPTCAYCSEHHETNACPHANKPSISPCCINCKRSKQDSEKHCHAANDRTCPTYTAEQNKLKKSIIFYQSKN